MKLAGPAELLVGLFTILAVAVFPFVVTMIGERRWRAQGVDLDDSTPAD